MKSYDKPQQHIKKQRHHFVDTGLYSQSYGFSVICGCDSWTIKKVERQRSDVFKLWGWRRLESPLDSKEIQPVNLKGNQSWIFTRRTDAETEKPILWLPDAKNWLLRKDWCWERLKAGGDGDNRGWDVWMASRTRRTWVWASSRRWWWTGNPGVVQSMGLQRVRCYWATELNDYITTMYLAPGHVCPSWQEPSD